jgi:hypothetical protein
MLLSPARAQRVEMKAQTEKLRRSNSDPNPRPADLSEMSCDCQHLVKVEWAYVARLFRAQYSLRAEFVPIGKLEKSVWLHAEFSRIDLTEHLDAKADRITSSNSNVIKKSEVVILFSKSSR